MAKDTFCSITLDGITLSDSKWTLHGFNLRITNIIAPKALFFLMSSDKVNITHSVNISASNFGQIKASERFNINIFNCFICCNKRVTSTLIDIINCNINIKNFIFFNQIKHSKGPALINAVESHINMDNVNFIQNYALDGLIWASNGSQLQVQNSMFNGNGLFLLTSGVLLLKHNSEIFLQNCKCENNSAIFAACIFASGNVSIFASNSIFDSNIAVKGGAIYWKNNIDYDQKNVDKTKTELALKKVEFFRNNLKENDFFKIYQSKLIFEKCLITGHRAYEGGVISVEGASVEVLMNTCIFEDNVGYKEAGSILVQGKHPSATKLRIEECHFDTQISYGAGLLYARQVQIDIHDCTIHFCAFTILTIADYSIVNMTHMSVRMSESLLSYVDIQNSVTFNIADSQITTLLVPGFPNGFILFARNNCSVYIRNTLIGDHNHNRIMTNVFGMSNFSSLEVRNCTFENSDYSYSRILTVLDNSKITFTNCLFINPNGFEVAQNSELHILNCYIFNSTYTLQTYALIEVSHDSHMYILNCFFKSNVLYGKKFFLISSNSTLTMFNSLYIDNTMSYHIAASGSDIMINHSIFHNNSVTSLGPGGFLVTNGTTFTIAHSLFSNNTIFGVIASLMTISANTISIQQCVIRNNFLDVGFQSLHANPFIAIHSSKYISLVGIMFYGNSLHLQFGAINGQAILSVLSNYRIPGSYIQIDNCTFGENDMLYAYIKDISNIFICHSTFYIPNRPKVDGGDVYIKG